jgi:uncharacterized membrane protein YdbT with pleckstrin-like domain
MIQDEKVIYSAIKVRRARWHLYMTSIIFVGLALYSWVFDIGFNETNLFGAIFLFFGMVLITYLEITIRVKRIIISNKRLIIDEGILSKQSMTIKYPMITEIIVKQSFSQRILGYGDIYIHTAGTQFQDIVMDSFTNPMKIKQTIEHFMHGTQAAQHQPNRQRNS